MIVKVKNFGWMAAPGFEETLQQALARLPARVPLHEIYLVLRVAKFWERGDKRGRVVRQRSHVRRWLRDRKKIRKNLGRLERNLCRIYDAFNADAYMHFMLRQLGGRPSRRRSLAPGTERVFVALNQLRAAIANDPVVSAQLDQPRRGQPSRPWLRWAEDELRRRRITKEQALELLRLIGLKPLE